MLKRLLLVCVLLASSAQADDLAAIAQRLHQPALLQGEFVQLKHIQVLSVPLRSSGDFSLQRDTGILWQTRQPMQSTLLISAQGIEGADIGDNRAMSYIGKVLNLILATDLDGLGQQFELHASWQAEGWTLQLTPRSALLRQAISRIELEGDEYIHRLQLFEAGGDRTDIRFSSLRQQHTPGSDIRDGLRASEP